MLKSLKTLLYLFSDNVFERKDILYRQKPNWAVCVLCGVVSFIGIWIISPFKRTFLLIIAFSLTIYFHNTQRNICSEIHYFAFKF